MKKMISTYKTIIAELNEEIKEGVLTGQDTVQVLRAEQPIFRDYRPVLDWYYDAATMQEEMDTPIEEMYMEDEFSKEEWAQMKQEHADYKKQYQDEKDKLEEIMVKELLTEMKQMQKLLG